MVIDVIYLEEISNYLSKKEFFKKEVLLSKKKEFFKKK